MRLIVFLNLLLAAETCFGGVCRILTQSDVNATTVSVRVLTEKKDRKCIAIMNQSGSSVLLIKFDSAHTGTENLSLAAGARWEPSNVPVNAVFLRSPAGVVTATVLEGK